jgi:hypothetical protein
MKKTKLIKKLTSLTLIGGGTLASLPLIISSCNSPTITTGLELAMNYLETHQAVLPDPGTQ